MAHFQMVGHGNAAVVGTVAELAAVVGAVAELAAVVGTAAELAGVVAADNVVEQTVDIVVDAVSFAHEEVLVSVAPAAAEYPTAPFRKD